MAASNRSCTVLRRKRRMKKRPEEIASYWIQRSEDPPGFEIVEFPIKGRGVVASEHRIKGDFLLVYKGENITDEEGERREAKEASGYRFFYKSKGRSLCIDATEESEFIGRLVNHGKKKERNSIMKEIDGHLCLFSLRDISKGDEILYDYGLQTLPWEETRQKKAKVHFAEMKSVREKFESGGKSNEEQAPHRVSVRDEYDQGGEFENEPVQNPDVVKETDQPKEELPEVGSAKSLINRFKSIQEEKAQPVASVKRQSPPYESEKIEYESQPTEHLPQYEGQMDTVVFESEPKGHEDVVRSGDQAEDYKPEEGSVKNILNIFKGIQTESSQHKAHEKREITPDRSGKVEYASEPCGEHIVHNDTHTESGVFENVPKEEEDIVCSGEKADEVLPESSMAKSLLSKFKQLETEVGHRPPPSPSRDTHKKAEFVNLPRGYLKKYMPQVEAGEFENKPADRGEVFCLEDHAEEILPEFGRAKKTMERFREIQKQSSSPISSKAKEITPSREQSPGRNVAGVFDNTPAERDDIARSDEATLDELPEQGTTRNILNRFKEIQTSGSQSTSPGKKQKEFTPPPEAGVYENKPQEHLIIESRQAESSVLERALSKSQADVSQEMEATLESELPEQGFAKNLVSPCKQLESTSSSAKSTSSMSPRFKEFTPRDSRGPMSPESPSAMTDGVHPSDLPGQYQPQDSTVIHENKPEVNDDVYNEADTDWKEGMLAPNTTASMLHRLKSIQEDAKASETMPEPVGGKDCGKEAESQIGSIVHISVENSGQTSQKVQNDELLMVVRSTEQGLQLEEYVSDSDCSTVIEEQANNPIPLQGVLRSPADSTTDDIEVSFSSSKPPEIVIQVAESGSKKDNNENGSRKRDYSKKHCCFFCEKEVSKMARHLEGQHNDIKEIAMLPKLKTGKDSANVLDSRKKVFSKYRNLGDFNHNVAVLLNKTGTFFVGRRPSANTKLYRVSDYLPCMYCLTFFIKKELWRHVKSCPFKEEKLSPESPEQAKKNSDDCIQNANYLLQGALGTQVFQPDESSEFTEYVLKRFRNDEISQVVKSDTLLLLFGRVQLRKLGTQRAGQVREKMRILGRLKIELRSVTSKESASIGDFISVDHFDTCMKAIGTLAVESNEKSSSGTRTYSKPSFALKAGQFMKKVAGLKRGRAIRSHNVESKDQADEFIRLYIEEFSENVSSLARRSLEERKHNKKTLLPLTEDLVKYMNHLEANMVRLTSQLLKDPCRKNWNSLAITTLARVLCFNKRRATEGAKVMVDQYKSRPACGNENKEIVQTLQPIEQNLMKQMNLIEVVGKNFKRVPVLLTKSMTSAFEALIDNRDDGGVSPSNPYVFAQGDFNFKRGSDCIRQTAYAAGLQYPERVTTTKLRKYLATVSQIFNLSTTELSELARHMGHELSVHRKFYRLQDDVIELAKVSRLLIAVEEGKAAEFKGCALDDINVADIPEEEIQPDEDEETDNEDTQVCDAEIQPDEDKETDNEDTQVCDAENLEDEELDSTDMLVSDSENPVFKGFQDKHEMRQTDNSTGNENASACKSLRPKKRWTIEEKDALTVIVRKATTEKRPPRKNEILCLQLKNPVLKTLNWRSIKYQVWAMTQKKLFAEKRMIQNLGLDS